MVIFSEQFNYSTLTTKIQWKIVEFFGAITTPCHFERRAKPVVEKSPKRSWDYVHADFSASRPAGAPVEMTHEIYAGGEKISPPAFPSPSSWVERAQRAQSKDLAVLKPCMLMLHKLNMHHARYIRLRRAAPCFAQYDIWGRQTAEDIIFCGRWQRAEYNI